MTEPHRWSFYRSGGVDQIIFRDGLDIANLHQLDQKLWMVLSMPLEGVEFDIRTAELINTNNDGKIRPVEILSAVEWAQEAFEDLTTLMRGGDSVLLTEIRDPKILAGARRLLANLGKKDADAVAMSDIADQSAIYASTLFNGDGVVTPEAAKEEETRHAMETILSITGEVIDLSGKPGVNRPNLDLFFERLTSWSEWFQQLHDQREELLPLELQAMRNAAGAIAAVRGKIDDFFTRCRLAAFDPHASAALHPNNDSYLKLAPLDLSLCSPEITALPLASIAAQAQLPLKGPSVNPAWESLIEAFQTKAATPLLGKKQNALNEAEWETLCKKIAPFEAWSASQPAESEPFEALDVEQIRGWLSQNQKEKIAELIERDEALRPETEQIAQVEKLIRFQRDLYLLLTNYVTFAHFYSQTSALFQAGTLFLDARACHLCLEVSDIAKHSTLAGLSGCYLAYCELTRTGEEKRTIVALITNGDSDNLMVGRNGLFYDRKGVDWDATIVKVVSNPINVREAFWLPYKKLIRMIEEQIAKRAQSASESSSDKMSGLVSGSSSPTKATASSKPLDLGTIALIGTAIGGISALVGGLLQALFGLGVWLPLGLAGVLLLISGPSMILAWLKLRQRNLGPILDASGWAINTKARLNVPFGSSLTRLAIAPEGSIRQLKDPYAPKKVTWKIFILLILLLMAGYLWWGEKGETLLKKTRAFSHPIAAEESTVP